MKKVINIIIMVVSLLFLIYSSFMIGRGIMMYSGGQKVVPVLYLVALIFTSVYIIIGYSRKNIFYYFAFVGSVALAELINDSAWAFFETINWLTYAPALVILACLFMLLGNPEMRYKRSLLISVIMFVSALFIAIYVTISRTNLVIVDKYIEPLVIAQNWIRLCFVSIVGLCVLTRKVKRMTFKKQEEQEEVKQIDAQ